LDGELRGWNWGGRLVSTEAIEPRKPGRENWEMKKRRRHDLNGWGSLIDVAEVKLEKGKERRRNKQTKRNRNRNRDRSKNTKEKKKRTKKKQKRQEGNKGSRNKQRQR
jgi:hypothetical protein